MTQKNWEGYSILKAVEGGVTAGDAIAIAKLWGAAEVVRRSSPYIGHYGLDILATKTQHQRITQGLFGGDK